MKKHQVALRGLRKVLVVQKQIAASREPIDRIKLDEEIRNLAESIKTLKADAGKK